MSRNPGSSAANSTHDMVGNQGKSKTLITLLMASGELIADDGRAWDEVIRKREAERRARYAGA